MKFFILIVLIVSTIGHIYRIISAFTHTSEEE